MPSPILLRAAGAQFVSELLALRPDVLGPVPPLSLTELSARLEHVMSLSLALGRIPVPALEVAEALAALGPSADLTSLAALLGVKTQAERTALARTVDLLRAHGLLSPDAALLRLEPLLAEQYDLPLHLGTPLDAVLARLTVEPLRAVLAAWNAPDAKATRAGLVASVHRILNDAGRIRAAVATAPDELREVLRQAAFGRPVMSSQLAGYRRAGTARTPMQDSLTWAESRLLLVRSNYFGSLVMPDPVALALRGPDWHAHFTPEQPNGTWTDVPADQVASATASSGTRALHVIGDLLRSLTSAPLQRRKDGAVGARELRRVAKHLDLTAEQIPMLLGLAHAAGLIGLDEKLILTANGRQWLESDPAPALTLLVRAWMAMPDVPSDQEDTTWLPGRRPGVPALRHALLRLLATHPDQAPLGDSLHDALFWEVPVLLGRGLLGPVDDFPVPANPRPGYPTGDDHQDFEDDEPSGSGAFEALVTEAAFLGIIAEGALSPLGGALLEQPTTQGIETLLAGILGTTQHQVVLQADLTATALGQPSGRLTTVLDRIATRETRSAAAVWRFSTASVRQALDSGLSADRILEDLSAISRGDIPQPLSYLIRDSARSHGILRTGEAVSYLRSDDVSLLAQVAADRKLRAHGLRLLAPTVLIATTPAGDLLKALRGAGYAPMPEGSKVTEAPVALELQPETPRPGEISMPIPASTPADHRQLVKRLFAESDTPPHLLRLPTTVIDARSLRSSTNSPGQQLF